MVYACFIVGKKNSSELGVSGTPEIAINRDFFDFFEKNTKKHPFFTKKHPFFTENPQIFGKIDPSGRFYTSKIAIFEKIQNSKNALQGLFLVHRKKMFTIYIYIYIW